MLRAYALCGELLLILLLLLLSMLQLMLLLLLLPPLLFGRINDYFGRVIGKIGRRVLQDAVDAVDSCKRQMVV